MLDRRVTETACPLCNLPRPRGAKRCLCNYTFEYEGPGRGARRTAGGGLTAVMLGVAAAAAVIAALVLRTQPGLDGHAGLGLLLVLIGAFAVAGGLFDWSWFMGNRRARRFVFLFGPTGARVFYALLGGALAGAGVLLALA